MLYLNVKVLASIFLLSSFDTSCLNIRIHVIVDSEKEAIFPSELNDKIILYCDHNGFKNLERFEAADDQFENIVDMITCFRSKMQISGNYFGSLNTTTLERFTELEEFYLGECE